MSASTANSEDPSIFTVETLIKYMGNDQKALSVVVKIVGDAIATGNEPLLRASAAVDAGDYAAAAHIFHGLRGSIGTLGTKRFVAAALALELGMAEKRHADVAPLLACAQAEFELALKHAHQWLSLHRA